MRFGIYLNPQTPGPAEDGRVIADVLGQVDYAAACGFESVWLTEHHFTGYNAYSDPFVLAAAISQRTPGLELGFALGVVPLHHPIRFATQCNLLDQLSGGKLVVGVGPGNCPDEFDGYGLDVEERRAMTAEFMDVVEKAWTAPASGFVYDGKHWNGEVRGRIIPSPVQQPYPRVAWGTGTLATLKNLIAPRGWSWMISSGFEPRRLAMYLHRYITAMDAAGYDDAAIQRAFAGSAYVLRPFIVEPGEAGRSEIASNIDLFIHRSQVANYGIYNQSPEQVASRRAFYDNAFFIGTAEDLIHHLRPYAELGIGTFMGWFNFGDMDDRLVKRSIDRFVRDVRPALDAAQPPADLFDRLRGLGEYAVERPSAPV